MRSAALLVFSTLAAAAISGCAVVQTEHGQGVAIYATGPAPTAEPGDRDDPSVAAHRQVVMICTGFKTMRLNCWRPQDEATPETAPALASDDRGVLDDVPATGVVRLRHTASTRGPLPRRDEPAPRVRESYAPRVPRPPQLLKPADPLAPGDARLRLPSAVAGVY